MGTTAFQRYVETPIQTLDGIIVTQPKHFGEDSLKTVHRTFQPGVPVILHLPALTDGSLSSKETTTPTLFVIQEGLNCLETTDYFFTNIEPKLMRVECPPAHHSTSTSHQPLNGDKVSQQTHPQQPEETWIHLSMLINRQVPVLNLTDIKITSHPDLQDAFNSLCVCSHGGKKIPKINTPSDQLSDSDTPEEEADPRLCTSEEERQYGTIRGSAQATQAALSHSRVQTNPTVERGPPRRPKIKKLPRDKAAEKGTQTKDKEKQT